MASEHGVKGYAPLSQSMSNTDTENEEEEDEEEDEEEEEEEDDLDRRVYSPRKHNQLSHQSSKQNDSTVIQENGRFYPLDETKNLANRLRNGRNNVNLSLGYCSDDIPIMVVDQDQGDDLWKRPHMSFVRQCCLAASIILCIATIVIFLYVLPCNDYDDSSQSVIKNRPGLLWDNTLSGIGLHGPITVVPGTPNNVIIMFREQLYGDNSGQTKGPVVPKGGGGVISLHGENGSPLWWSILDRLPTEIDCKNLDADNSGAPDCVVVGENGLLAVITLVAGTCQWSSKDKFHSKIPVFLPDVDNDGIDDLLTVQITKEDVLALALVSGKNGYLLGHHLRPDCRRIRIYSIDRSATISYLCHDSNGKQSMKTISITDLFDGINVSQFKKKLSTKLKGLPNPFVIAEKNSEQDSQGLTPYHQLSIQRHGSCPGEFCQTTVNVTFQSDSLNESRLIWSNTGLNAYGMEPALLTDMEKPFVTGFVMKFWRWDNDLDLNNHVDKRNSSVLKRTITEWTLVVIINQTEVHPVNASQTDINQICKASGTECQPSSKLQSQSVLVTDLNHDGSRELISYQISYEFEREILVLKSRVQVFRLDTEVAKLTQIVIT